MADKYRLLSDSKLVLRRQCIANCLLPIAYCPLPIANCPLNHLGTQIAYLLLNVSGHIKLWISGTKFLNGDQLQSL
jgi:hypothetical protein